MMMPADEPFFKGDGWTTNQLGIEMDACIYVR